MKASLMHPDHDFTVSQPLPANAPELIQDLELDTLVDAMAAGDEIVEAAARTALLCGTTDLATIRYRQAVLRDCLRLPQMAVDLYEAANAAINGERKIYSPLFGRTPEGQVSRSLQVLRLLLSTLRHLRAIAGRHAAQLRSDGLKALFTTIERDLPDDYLAMIDDHLKTLTFPEGPWISARLGRGNRGEHHVLREPPHRDGRLLSRLTARRPPHLSVTVDDRDVAGYQALRDLTDQGIVLVGAALAEATTHVLRFLMTLRTELAFYIGCLRLDAELRRRGEETCFPVPVPMNERRFACAHLYDVCLALRLERPVVGNDLHLEGKEVTMVTGANQGGKSTFLRSVGLAQLMMRAGMYVAADSFRANVCEDLFTHYKREEDATLASGKLDEELSRMSDIAEHLRPNCMLLCNESFASTNEQEGSEIADQIIHALMDKRIQIIFVTHFYELANGLFEQHLPTVAFLRAERLADGGRTYRMIVGPPEESSHGVDLYQEVFEADGVKGRPADP